MLGLDAWTIVVAVAIVLLGGTISGVTGFGFGLVVVPFLLILFPPATVVLTAKGLGLLTGVAILLADHRHADRPTIAGLAPWAYLGLPFGLLILRRVDAEVIRLVAGAVVVLFAALATTGRLPPGIRSPRAPRVVGVASGVLGTSIGMPGPPVVLLLSSHELEPVAFRATITGYFAVVDTFAVVLLFATGTVGVHEAAIALGLFPVALVGRSLGRILGLRVERERFRRLTLGLLILTGLSAVATALLALR